MFNQEDSKIAHVLDDQFSLSKIVTAILSPQRADITRLSNSLREIETSQEERPRKVSTKRKQKKAKMRLPC